MPSFAFAHQSPREMIVDSQASPPTLHHQPRPQYGSEQSMQEPSHQRHPGFSQQSHQVFGSLLFLMEIL
jgi:hypothetical protein